MAEALLRQQLESLQVQLANLQASEFSKADRIQGIIAWFFDTKLGRNR
jgi:hypothetical protein